MDVLHTQLPPKEKDHAPTENVRMTGSMPVDGQEIGSSLEPATPAALCEKAKIMIVDDEPLNIKVVQTHLSFAGYHRFVTSVDPRPVLEMIAVEKPDVILLDIMMPEVSGLDILRQKHDIEFLSHIPVIVLTAAENEEIKMEALNLGAADFLNKPVNLAELVVRVRNVLLVKAYQDQLLRYAQDLSIQVSRRTAELAASRLELIHSLARAAEYRDNETGRHVIRVGRYAGVIARRMGLEPSFVELIESAAPLHDMGKIGIPDAVLLKPGKLTPDELALMQKHSGYGKYTFEPMSDDDWKAFKSHTYLGEKILEEQNSPLIALASSIALTHHEKWDGTGYPLGLSGEDIPLASRITAVADVFDALSSRRPYKPAFPLNRCFEIMQEGRGSHFDPKVLDAFLASRDEIIAIRMELTDVD